MKKIIFFFISAMFISCGSGKKSTESVNAKKIEFATEINADDLKEHLYIFASDILEGRRTGEKGQKMAANYLTAYYKNLGLKAPKGHDDYLQIIPKEFFKNASKASSENVVAYIEGSELPNEILVISAHYDHLGKKGEEVYNGADDDGSGTTALMEIAQAFQVAAKKGYRPKRSILFLHLTGEEEGLFGSKYYTSHPIFPLNNTVANLNIDMVGRVDEKHKNNPNYIYLIGADKLSSELHKLSEETNKIYSKLKLDYTYNDEKDPNRFYYRSDHYNFAKNNIPVIFYFNGVHEDYHKPTDTPDKINYEILAKRAQLVFYTAWEIVNRENKLVVDKK
ncbi:Aminopeptidase [hydrothermal vent metagenome]|uniref:Aminopeptidase n=1 Tax=hydrothermal vent metagenome TaxID=652676 RepID=A0A3B0TGL8_9ZZZZ